MTDYYISSINGSDEHTGFESSTPWKSFSILNTLDLEAGDRIFLEAGSVFNDTLELVDDYGNKDQPIIFSTYGEGSAPRIISDTGSGILAARSKHVVVENIEIGPTVNSGIEARDSDFWTIRNVSITDAGGEDRNFGSINWKDSNDLIFENNTILDSYGDGIYLSNVDGVVIKDNYIEGTHSRDADNIQITGTDVVIENNILINGLNDVTTKGNIVFHGENLFLGDNYLEGGSFGISTSADQVVIEDNVFKNHDKYSWSGGVVVSDAVTGDVFDGLVVKGNEFKDGSNGMSFYGASETKYSSDILTIQDINISDNLFFNWDDKVIRFTNTNPEGDYQDNIYYQEYDEYYSHSFHESDTSSFNMSNNIYVDSAQAVIDDFKTVTIEASAAIYDGAPIMEVYYNGDLILETEVNAQRSLKESELFSFDLYDYSETDRIEIKFVNDKFNFQTKEDRNLYVNDVRVDDQSISFWDVNFSGKAYTNKARDYIKFSSKGSAFIKGEDAYLTRDDDLPAVQDIISKEDFISIAEGENKIIGAGSDLSGGSFEVDHTYVDTTLEQVLTEYF